MLSPVHHEAQRTLVLMPDQWMSETSQIIGSSVSFPDQFQVDIIAGMDLGSEGTLTVLEILTEDISQVVRDTVRRIQSRQSSVEVSRLEPGNTDTWLKQLQSEGDRYAGGFSLVTMRRGVRTVIDGIVEGRCGAGLEWNRKTKGPSTTAGSNSATN